MAFVVKETTKKLIRKLGLEVKKYKAPPGNPLVHWKTDLLLDVGANVGQYARKSRIEGYSGKIVSFEPLPDAYEKLKHASAADPLWTIYKRCAIGSKEGQTEINISKNSYSSSLLPMGQTHLEAAPESEYIGTAKTQVMTLDSMADEVLKQSSRPYLKIDTQGYEAEVLAGANNLINKLLAIQLELSIVPLYEGQKLYGHFFDLLSGKGFELWSIMPGFTNQDTGQTLQFDGIFVRKEILPTANSR